MDDTTTKQSKMEELLASEDQPSLPKEGDVAQATVIGVSSNEIHLDIDGITTGVVRGRELLDESGTYSNLSVGDEVEATVLEAENERGEMELSFRQAGHQKAWDNLESLKAEAEVISVPVSEANKGGLMVQVGKIDGFLPVSQLTVEHYPRVEGGEKNKILEKLQQFVGKELKVKVIDVDESDNKLIVSEKAAWEEKQQERISEYNVGDIVEGKITGVVDFGAFIEFGNNLEGLVHISELAWQRIDDPREYVSVGDQVKAKIISIDGSKISLSIKALKEDPWQEAMKRYKVGEIVEGKVIKINHFGVFVELDQDIHGLAHISELSEKRVHDPAEVVNVGEAHSFKILSIEPENHRLGLSLKAARKKAVPTPQPTETDPEADAASLGVSKEEKEDKADAEPPKEPVKEKQSMADREETAESEDTSTDEK